MGVLELVTVAYHRPDHLARLLGGAAGIPAVVVNVEADPAVAEVARAAGATVVDLTHNVGYAAAVNAGARRASADVVVFANDDVVADAASLRALADVVRRAEADVAVPQLVGAGGPQRSLLVPATPWRLALEWMLLPDEPVGWLARWCTVAKWRLPRQPERVYGAAAAVVAVGRRTLLEEPLPEAYFLYWEEQEWFWRLRRRGLVVQYRPEIVVRHFGGRDDVRPEKCALLARNAVRCVRRTQGPIAAALAWPIVIGWWLRLLVVDVLLARGLHRLRARWVGLCAAVAAVREVTGGS